VSPPLPLPKIVSLIPDLLLVLLVRRELEAGSAEGREGDGEPEGSRAGARRVGSVGAEEEEALLPLGRRRRGDGVGGSSHGVGSPPDYLERK